MSDFDKEAWEEALRVRDERLAPLMARLGGKPRGMISIGPGWFDLVLELDATLAEIDPDYRVLQIKEKFGGLCYYVQTSPGYEMTGDYMNDPFYAPIRAAEARSTTICEDCGTDGELRPGGWVVTLCDACLAGRGDDRKIK
jgi:hypothetical protein